MQSYAVTVQQLLIIYDYLYVQHFIFYHLSWRRRTTQLATELHFLSLSPQSITRGIQEIILSAAFNKVKFESVLRSVRSSSLKLLFLQGYIKNFHHAMWQILLSLSCHFSVKPSWDTSLWLKGKVPLKSKVIFSLSYFFSGCMYQSAKTYISNRGDREGFDKIEFHYSFAGTKFGFNWMWKTLTDLLPSFLQIPEWFLSWKTQTFRKTFWGQYSYVGFPALGTLGSVALQKHWRISMVLARGRDGRAPRALGLTALG